MKHFKTFLIPFLFLFSACAFSEEMSSGVKTVMGILTPFIGQYAERFPVIGNIIELMITARIVIKPIMSALLTIYKDRPQFKFLSFSDSVLENKIYKTVAFVLDYVASIKLPKSK